MLDDHHSRDRSVQGMFDRIAGRYDLLNRVISFRCDARWRRQVIAAAASGTTGRLLDLGTGTGDLLFDALPALNAEATLTGLDFSLEMLRVADAKRRLSDKASRIALVMGNAQMPPFRTASFDAATSAFVLRNLSDVSAFFIEAHRVLKPGGKLVALDMFPPPPGWFAALYSIYFHHMMPRIGSVLGRDRAAYQYLSDSVRHFYSPEAVSAMIERAGFQQVALRKFLGGAVCMHIAEKAGAMAQV